MKKEIYITLFSFLGLLGHFLIFELVELWYITSSSRDFYGAIAWAAAIIWMAIGMICGFMEGKFFWRKIYVEKVRKETIFKWLAKKH